GPVAWVSPPRPHQPEDGESEDTQQDRATRMTEDERCCVGRFRPAPPIEIDAGPVGEQVQPPEVEPLLGAVLDSGIDPIQEVVPPCAGDHLGKMDKRSPDVLFQSRVLSQAQALLELLEPTGQL